MALPADITEDYLSFCAPELKKFWEIVARRAPENIQARVSEFNSQVSSGKCIFRDRNGDVLYETPDPPPPVKQRATQRSTGVSADQFQRTKDFLSQTNELALLLAQGIEKHSARLDSLAEKVESMKKQLDQERRGITFRGPWQVAIDYEPGAIVTYSERAYVASKAIRCGGQPPARHGSGWLHMFDATEVLR